MRWVLAIAATLLLLVSASPADAGGPLRRLFHGRAAMHIRTTHPPLDARQVYPKYQAGFHARSLQNIGVPSGDIGLRGNGIHPSPW